MCKKSLIVILVAGALLSSCSLATGPTSATVDITGALPTLQSVFMSSYYAESGSSPASDSRALTPFRQPTLGTTGAAARATVPVGSLTSTGFAALNPKIFANYPESGQTTTFTATKVSVANNVYLISATTTFAATDLRKTYVEEYYIRDIGLNGSSQFDTATPDNIWDTNDPIVTDPNAPVQDQKSRAKMRLTFQDGTTRDETILYASGGPSDPKFDPAAFSITGSLELGQTFVPTTSVDTSVMYSSIVAYKVQPSVGYNFWFWAGASVQSILGIRYYTEKADSASSKYIGYTASFEKTVNSLATSATSTWSDANGIFSGSTYTALAQSVLRQTVSWNLSGTSPVLTTAPTRITNMKTRIINIENQKDYYLSLLNSEYATLTQLDGSLYVPTGASAEIVAADTTNTRTLITDTTTGTAGSHPLVTTNTSGLGALAQLYTAITEGTATNVVAGTTPPANVGPAAGTVWEFNGQQNVGNSLGTNAAWDLTTTGNIELWVYINAMTDTFGIVHKGSAVDFSDESYSLQGWSNSGQIAFLITNAARTSYDMVQSTINLNTKKWYHIVANWDCTLGNNNSYIRLYINGALNKSMKPSVVKTVGATASPASGLLIGSQLPTSYSSTYGYFGLNGKILGVNIGATPLTAAQVTANYNASLGASASW